MGAPDTQLKFTVQSSRGWWSRGGPGSRIGGQTCDALADLDLVAEGGCGTIKGLQKKAEQGAMAELAHDSGQK
ncbi:hypothetical protein Baya_9665 [Bagarius yarrelli]|uniref:Uncharacterized protein n=1 Tax=Bagarius yarrelli TaxID=175774 RepID=A0A556UXV3_BAGYA|nr:hypothetical protein Baya_9665 [Bagarius yarrelli]